MFLAKKSLILFNHSAFTHTGLFLAFAIFVKEKRDSMVDPEIIVDYAKRTGKLKIGFSDYLNFYGIPFLFIAAFFDLLLILTGSELDKGVLIINLIFIAVFAWMFTARRKSLDFTVVETTLSKERLFSLIQETIRYYGWEVRVLDSDIIVADYNAYVDRSLDPPIVTRRAVGERITIVFHDNKVLINSILNLDKATRSSFGNRESYNLDNVDIIKEEILRKEEYDKAQRE